MRPAAAVRGSALPETAIVLTATLALIFGVIQIGVIGFLQIMVDGAAFVAAHEYALNNTTGYLAAVAKPFPLAGTAKIDQMMPDPESVPVNFHVNLTNARRGGVSLVRSSHLMATVQNSAPSGLLGVGLAALSNIQVHGSAIEPFNRVSNDVYDVDQAGYSSNTAVQVDFYSDVQNAAANYLSFQQMSRCASAVFGTNCPSTEIRAVGNAEFLDHDNWARTTLGVGLGPALSNSSGYTFGEMLCHQQKYAAAAAYFPVVTALSQIKHVSITSSSYPVLGVIYGWDYITEQGGGNQPGSEANFDLFPLHPAKGC